MVDKNSITQLLHKKLNITISGSDLVSESYILSKDELDAELLPSNFYNVMTNMYYLVHFFYYEEIIVYIFYNPDTSKQILTGILQNERLVYSKYE